MKGDSIPQRVHGSVRRLALVQFLSWTDEGWLLFYHGVITTCNGFRYSMGAAILDKDNPEKVLYRTRPYLLAPNAPLRVAG